MKFILFVIFFLYNIFAYGKDVIIGDSNVKVVSNTNGFSSLNLKIGVNKRGINTSMLANLVKHISVDTTCHNVFILIGTNDAYLTNNSHELYNIVRSKYPNAKLYIVWGSRGWGNVRHKTIFNQEQFYSNFEKNGFTQIKITNGYFKNDVLAHTPNQKYQIEIIKQIKINI